MDSVSPISTPSHVTSPPSPPPPGLSVTRPTPPDPLVSPLSSCRLTFLGITRASRGAPPPKRTIRQNWICWRSKIPLLNLRGIWRPAGDMYVCIYGGGLGGVGVVTVHCQEKTQRKTNVTWPWHKSLTWPFVLWQIIGKEICCYDNDKYLGAERYRLKRGINQSIATRFSSYFIR